LKVFHAFIQLGKAFRPTFFLANFLERFFSLFWVVPKLGIMGNGLFLSYLTYFRIDVKVTSLTPAGAHRKQ
jgi:hypothetical protein